MLVEDDTNLREIYQARLSAEGYEIVTAKDGEEALALAVKEKPDLIILDVMMPKVSGFDVLDILRSTAEIKNTKVIMMTALSQAEDKERADKLGADRYLVKSQVTLEDVVRVAKEVLDGTSANPTQAAIAKPLASTLTTDTVAVKSPSAPLAVPTSETQETTSTATAPISTDTTPVVVSPPPPPDVPQSTDDLATVANATTSADDATTDPTAISNDQVLADAVAKINTPSETDKKSSTNIPVSVNNSDNPDNPQSSSSGGNKIIQPLNEITQTRPDIHELLAKEEAKEQSTGSTSIPVTHAPESTIAPANNQPPQSAT